MNSMLKNALMVTLILSAGSAAYASSEDMMLDTFAASAAAAKAPLQSAVSSIARTSLGDVVVAYCDACDAIVEAAKQGAIIVGNAACTVGKKVLTTTPRDVYNFVSHPDTLAVAGVTVAGYAIYKYVQNMPVAHYCPTCSTQWDGPAKQTCPSCTKWHELQQVCALQELEAALIETHDVLDETNTELAKLQVALQELSDTTQVS